MYKIFVLPLRKSITRFFGKIIQFVYVLTKSVLLSCLRLVTQGQLTCTSFLPSFYDYVLTSNRSDIARQHINVETCTKTCAIESLRDFLLRKRRFVSYVGYYSVVYLLNKNGTVKGYDNRYNYSNYIIAHNDNEAKVAV